jgi:hypothetical protein
LVRTNLGLFGSARAARGNRQSMFGNSSRARSHLESCGGYNVRCSGELGAVCGFPDAQRGNVVVSFGFARPTDGLAESFRGVTGSEGWYQRVNVLNGLHEGGSQE